MNAVKGRTEPASLKTQHRAPSAGNAQRHHRPARCQRRKAPARAVCWPLRSNGSHRARSGGRASPPTPSRTTFSVRAPPKSGDGTAGGCQRNLGPADRSYRSAKGARKKTTGLLGNALLSKPGPAELLAWRVYGGVRFPVQPGRRGPGFMIRLGDGADSSGAVGGLGGDGAWPEVAGWFEQRAAQVLQEPQAARSHGQAAPATGGPVQDGPDQGQATGLAGEPADDLDSPARFAEGSLDDCLEPPR
jgi:hypothetical protein